VEINGSENITIPIKHTTVQKFYTVLLSPWLLLWSLFNESETTAEAKCYDSMNTYEEVRVGKTNLEISNLGTWCIGKDSSDLYSEKSQHKSRRITISSMWYTLSEICLLNITQKGIMSCQFYQYMNWRYSTKIR
jgi:hypothetical protein